MEVRFRMNRTTRFQRLLLAAVLCSLPGTSQTPAGRQRGPELYRGGNCSEARTALEASAAAGGLSLARCFMESGDYARALDAVTSYRSAKPSDDIAAITVQIQILATLNRVEEAVPLVEAFLTQNPEDLPVRDALGDAFATAGQTDKAAEQYKKVLDAWPDDPGAHIGVGELASREKHWQDAIAEFDKAKEIVRNDFRVLKGTGLAYVQMGQCAQAVAPLQQALSLAPSEVDVAKSLAKCSVELGQWREVLAALRTGAVNEAKDEECTAMVVQAFEKLNDKSGGAARYLRGILNQRDDNYAAHLDLADLLYNPPDPKQLVKDPATVADIQRNYAAAVKLRTDYPARIEERLGDLAAALNQAGEARKAYEAAFQQKDATDDIRMKLATNCFSANDDACASKALKAVASPDKQKDVKSLQAQIAFRSNNFDEAGTLANQVLSADPDHPDVRIVRIAADVARRQGKPKEAADLYAKALALDPNDRETRRSLVLIYLNDEELNGVSQAIDLLNEYLNKIDKDTEFYLMLGYAYNSRKDFDNARRYYSTGYTQITPPAPARYSNYLDDYGVLLVNVDKNYKDAYPIFTDAIGKNPKDETALYNLVLTCLELGKEDELADTLQKLRDLNSSRVADLETLIQNAHKKAEKTK